MIWVMIPETELIEQFWPGKVQPVTAVPLVNIEDGRVHISCDTKGASVEYKFPVDEIPGIGWRIYTNPIELPEGK
jgi:hypothetical protein